MQPNMQRTIFIKDRTYTSWSWDENNEEQCQDIHPLTHRLFHGDTIDISAPIAQISILHSPVRQSKHIAGVLVLQGNKTYGRTPNKKRLYYRVIPQQSSLPYFLVPYDVQLTFHKMLKNKYVLFKFDSWNEQHPIGQLTETLGDVDHLEAFYDYQLYSKSLNATIQEMTKFTIEKTKQKTIQQYFEEIRTSSNYVIIDNTHIEGIITIDPRGSVDRDDAISIQKISEESWVVSVYLTNVYVWLEALTLWRSFSSRVSTIYLPDRRRPMLPNIFSDQLCSLNKGQERFVMQVDFCIKRGNIESATIISSRIRIAHNYTYDDEMLHEDSTYMQLQQMTKQLMSESNGLPTSNDLISFWMIQTNKYCASIMKAKQIGIYRMIKPTIDTKREMEIPEEAAKEQSVQNWISCSGQYTLYDESSTNHLFLKTDAYVQITSPIRRLVDLLNQMIIFQSYHFVALSDGAQAFVDQWCQQMDYINTSMRSIRKIQVDCALLYKLYDNQTLLQEKHEGIVFDRFERNNGMFSYMVYLEKLKLLSRMNTIVNVENNSRHMFKVFLFENEDNTKKKVRVEFSSI